MRLMTSFHGHCLIAHAVLFSSPCREQAFELHSGHHALSSLSHFLHCTFSFTIQLESSCALHRFFLSGLPSAASISSSFLVQSFLTEIKHLSQVVLSLQTPKQAVNMGNLVWHDLARFIAIGASICTFCGYYEVHTSLF